MKRLIDDIVAPQIAEIIKGKAIMDDYTYEVSMDLLPGEDGPAPTLVILLAVPHPVDIGRKLSAITFCPGPVPDPTLLRMTVEHLVDGVAELRAKEVTVLP